MHSREHNLSIFGLSELLVCCYRVSTMGKFGAKFFLVYFWMWRNYPNGKNAPRSGLYFFFSYRPYVPAGCSLKSRMMYLGKSLQTKPLCRFACCRLDWNLQVKQWDTSVQVNRITATSRKLTMAIVSFSSRSQHYT